MKNKIIYYDKDKESYKDLIKETGIEYIPVSYDNKYKVLVEDIIDDEEG